VPFRAYRAPVGDLAALGAVPLGYNQPVWPARAA